MLCSSAGDMEHINPMDPGRGAQCTQAALRFQTWTRIQAYGSTQALQGGKSLVVW